MSRVANKGVWSLFHLKKKKTEWFPFQQMNSVYKKLNRGGCQLSVLSSVDHRIIYYRWCCHRKLMAVWLRGWVAFSSSSLFFLRWWGQFFFDNHLKLISSKRLLGSLSDQRLQRAVHPTLGTVEHGAHLCKLVHNCEVERQKTQKLIWLNCLPCSSSF
jgi:hypothetical protein